MKFDNSVIWRAYNCFFKDNRFVNDLDVYLLSNFFPKALPDPSHWKLCIVEFMRFNWNVLFASFLILKVLQRKRIPNTWAPVNCCIIFLTLQYALKFSNSIWPIQTLGMIGFVTDDRRDTKERKRKKWKSRGHLPDDHSFTSCTSSSNQSQAHRLIPSKVVFHVFSMSFSSKENYVISKITPTTTWQIQPTKGYYPTLVKPTFIS